MDLTPYFIGAGIGLVVGYLIAYLVVKSNAVDRKTYDALSDKWNEAQTNLKLADERLRSQQELTNALQQKTETRDGELQSLLSRTASLEAQLKSTADRLNEHTQTLEREKETNRQQQGEIQLHQRQVVELRSQNESLREKLETQKLEIAEMQRVAQLQFEKLAQQIFEEKSGKFTEANKTNIEAILKPLSENIDAFKKKVEETYEKDSKDRILLNERVKDLIENTHKVSEEANNLATALKGQAKKQGDWGETILERILELSGLEKGREYFIQENLKNEEGQNVRPDVIVRLPDNRNIVIDSKVSMNAYIRYTETTDKDQQDICLAQHLTAIHSHVDQLSSKRYNELLPSLDYTLMFIPVEPAYMLAVQADPHLWSTAYAKKIVLMSPSILVPTLRVIADLWKIEVQNKSALEIAQEGSRMYDKFMGFLESMEDLGKSLTKSQESYLKAVGQLKEGKGNLISRTEKLKKLGIKSAKRLPPAFHAPDQDEDELPDPEFGNEAPSD